MSTFPNILKPGCGGCLSPHEWQHDDDCPGKSEDAGHRHVKDILGHSVYVGDQVVAMVSYASGSSTRRSAMVLGIVLEILPAHAKVSCDVPMGDTRPGRRGCLVAKVIQVADRHLVKVTERRP